MPVEPELIDRIEQPYAGIRGSVTIDDFDKVQDRLPEVYKWLESKGIAPTGESFLRVNTSDMSRELEIEVGVPIADRTSSSGEVFIDVLPAGRYVTAAHSGRSDGLIAATQEVFDWTEKHQVLLDRHETDRGPRWGCRLMIDQSDSEQIRYWDAELLFRVAD